VAAPQSTARHYRQQQALTLATIAAVQRAWAGMRPDLDASWPQVLRRIYVVLTAAQLRAARSATTYMDDVLEELGIDAPPVADVTPQAFAGRAADGRPLDTLLRGAVVEAKKARLVVRDADGNEAPAASIGEALDRGERWLKLVVQSELADAERGATGVATTARPNLRGHVRYLNPPACGRCTVLAGRTYRWSEGFARHDRCDCRMIPVGDDVPDGLIADPMEAYRKGLVHGLSEADRKAIDDGADITRVVNVRRDKAGLKKAGRVWSRSGRPTPEAIYAMADDRAEAIRLLARHGYIRNT
jgi:hypothetical protein